MSWAPRAAVRGDAPAIRALVQAAYAAYVERIGVRPAPMDIDPIGEMETKEVWVAEDAGAVVGVVVVRVEPDHLFVDNLAVLPGAQGRGLGTELLAVAERRAAQLERPEIRLLTHERMTENRAIYAHLGWEETGVRVEHGYPRVYLRKPIPPAHG